tara:strand:+ start:6469 stop:6603 length:135 start_codon:yes stop_codon:yes gene_type:complete
MECVGECCPVGIPAVASLQPKLALIFQLSDKPYALKGNTIESCA